MTIKVAFLILIMSLMVSAGNKYSSNDPKVYESSSWSIDLQVEDKEESIIYSNGRVTTNTEIQLLSGFDVFPVVADTNAFPVTPGWQTRGIAAGSDLDQDGLKEIIITDHQVHGVHVYEVISDNTLEWVATLSDTLTSYSNTPRHVITIG